MIPRRWVLARAAQAVAALATTTLGRRAGATADENISLMQSIEAWMYPDADFHGARMSDGGSPGIQSVKLQTVLTTPAPFDDVVKFYSSKAGVDPDSPDGDGRVEASRAEPKSVAVQDDSKGRPVRVRVFAVHAGEVSTTIVLTRAEGETSTHIAWSQYRRIGK